MNGRFKLDGADMMNLMITTIAAGTKIPGITLDSIIDILPGFFDISKCTLATMFQRLPTKLICKFNGP